MPSSIFKHATFLHHVLIGILAAGLLNACRTTNGRVSSVNAASPLTGSTVYPALQPLDVQGMITDAYNNKETSVLLPPGTWAVNVPSGASAHITLTDLQNFEIQGSNTTLVFADPRVNGLLMNNCRNVKISGLNFDYNILPFSEGVIKAIDSAGKYIDIEMAPGYPANIDDPSFFPALNVLYIFDPQTLQLKVGSNDVYYNGVTKLDEHLFRVNTTNRSSNAAVGDFFTMRAKFVVTLLAQGCSQITWSSDHVYTGGFAFFENAGAGGNVYENVSVTYGPKPQSAVMQRLLSTNADALHSDGVVHGPNIQGSLFEGMADDGTNITGRFVMVLELSGNTLTVGTSRPGTYQVGDLLRVLDQTGATLGEARITAIGQPLAKYTPPITPSFDGFKATQFFTLDVDTPAVFKPGAMAWDVNASGDGFLIQNTTYRNNRGRGIVVKADNGQILNNVIDGPSMTGILISPEYPATEEASYVRNLVVQGNTITHVCRSLSNQFNGIKLTGAAGRSHQNIKINGNSFVDNYCIDLYLGAAVQVTADQNIFGGKSATVAAAATAVASTPLITLSNIDSVEISANTYPDSQTNHVETGKDVTNAQVQ